MENITNVSHVDTCELNAFEKRYFVRNEPYRQSANVVCISIGMLGTVGNMLAFYVIRMAKQSSMTFLLKCLAISDTSFLLALIDMKIHNYIKHTDLRWKSSFGCVYSTFIEYYIKHPLIYMIHTVNVWIFVLIGLNRYIIVCCPLSAKRFSRIAVNKRIICIIILCSFLLHCWHGAFYTVVNCYRSTDICAPHCHEKAQRNPSFIFNQNCCSSVSCVYCLPVDIGRIARSIFVQICFQN